MEIPTRRENRCFASRTSASSRPSSSPPLTTQRNFSVRPFSLFDILARCAPSTIAPLLPQDLANHLNLQRCPPQPRTAARSPPARPSAVPSLTSSHANTRSTCTSAYVKTSFVKSTEYRALCKRSAWVGRKTVRDIQRRLIHGSVTGSWCVVQEEGPQGYQGDPRFR